MELSSPETLPQPSCCAESCLRCIVLVVLLGPPLMITYYFLFFQVASATSTRYGLSRGLLGLEYDRINISGSDSDSVRRGALCRFVWFGEGQDGSSAPGLRELGSSKTRREERT